MESPSNPQNDNSNPEGIEKKDKSLLYMGVILGAIILVMGYLTFFVEDISALFSQKETVITVVDDKSDLLNQNSSMSDSEVKSSLIKFVDAFYNDQRKGYFDPPSYFATITQTYYNFHNLTFKRLGEIHRKRFNELRNFNLNWIVSSLDFKRNGDQLIVNYWTQVSYLKPSINKQESADVKNEMIIDEEGKIISLREVEIKNLTSYDFIPEPDTLGGEETGFVEPIDEESLTPDPSTLTNQPVEEKYEGKLYDLGTVEISPEFPGGQKALAMYLASNLKYPILARDNNIQGKVYVGFVIEKSGDLTDLKIIKGIGGGCDEEALRVLRSCPFWKPGTVAGKAVRTAFTFPITFQLAD